MSVEVLDLANEAGGLRPVRPRGRAADQACSRSRAATGAATPSAGSSRTRPTCSTSSTRSCKDIGRGEAARRPDVGPAPGERARRAAGSSTRPGSRARAWRLVALPDDPALGEFRKDFAGAVGVFAEYPQPAKGSQSRVHRSDRDHRPPGALQAARGGRCGTRSRRALLRARLVDVFMGDWDRHRQQWRWAKLTGQPAVHADPRGPRPGVLALRRLPARTAPGHATRASRTSGRATRASAASPSTAGTRTVACWRASRARTSSRRRRSWQARAHRRGDRGGGAPDAARVVRDRRHAPRLRPARAARRAARGGGEVLPAPRDGVDVYLTNRSERVEAARTPNGDMEVTVRALDGGGPAGGDHLPPRVPRERDGGGALLRARRATTRSP